MLGATRARWYVRHYDERKGWRMKREWKLAAVAAMAIALTGCATMDALSGMGVLTQKTSAYDGGEVINVSGQSLYAPGDALGSPFQLGATWLSAHPDLVSLDISYRSNVNAGSAAYASIEGLDVRIDGLESQWRAHGTRLDSTPYNTVSRTIYTTSSTSIVVPLNMLRAMVQSQDCRLRIYTSQGSTDVLFSRDTIPGGKHTAITGIRKLLAAVDAYQAAHRAPSGP